jgi:hypothetical protein
MADHNTLNVFEEKGSRPIEELLQEHWKIVDQGLGVARGTGPLERVATNSFVEVLY